MDMLLLAITVISLIAALVMSVTAWRLMRDEKRRSAARIAALSAAANDDGSAVGAFVDEPPPAVAVIPTARTPWKPAPFAASSSEKAADASLSRSEKAVDDPLSRADDLDLPGAAVSPAPGFLGSPTIERSDGGRQRGLAIATLIFFTAIAGSFIVRMAGAGATPSAAAVDAGAPLELVSLSHAREDRTLAVSGLVRNPVAGKPVEKLSAVVFLFDRAGTFVTSSRAQVDFLKLGSGDESPFVVSIDAPESVARYRVSFRTDQRVVPHVDRRGQSPVNGEQPVNVTLK